MLVKVLLAAMVAGVCLLLASPAAAATQSVTLQDCEAAYNRTLTKKNLSFDDRCSAKDTYQRCALRVLVDIKDDVDAVASLVVSARAIAENAHFLGCPKDEVATVRPQMAVAGGNIEFHVGKDKDVQFMKHSVASMTLGELVDSVTEAVSDDFSTLTETIDAGRTAAVTAANNAKAQVASRVPTVFSTGVAAASNLLASLSAAVSTQGSAVLSASNTLKAEQSSKSLALEAEAATVFTWPHKLANTLAQIRGKASSSFIADTIDGVALQLEDTDYLASVSSNYVVSLNAFSVTENARSATQFASLLAQISTATVTCVSDQSIAIATQASRADVASVSIIAASLPKVKPASGTDLAACSSEGSQYYSTVNKKIYFCNGAYFVPIPLVNLGFTGSSILNNVQNAALIAQVEYSGWVLCYSGAVHGWATSTFRSLCLNKGPTMIIGLSNISNKIGGGFYDVSWKNLNNYGSSNRAFLWTFNSNVLSRTVQVYPQNAVYDHVSYGPTFGGGHDWYLTSGMTTGSCSPHSYTAANYNSNWLLGGSSFTLTKLEVYYQV